MRRRQINPMNLSKSTMLKKGVFRMTRIQKLPC